MKLLHTSDWHLGRTLYNAPRTADHEKVLAEILDLARHEQPDLVVHTGDLFESVRPAYDDMERGVGALLALADVAPVVVLCGNHDSPALFRLFGDLLSRGRALSPADLRDAERSVRRPAIGPARRPAIVAARDDDEPSSARTDWHGHPRVRFVDKARPADLGGVLTFGSKRGETIRLATLPFVHANRMVPAFERPDTWMAAYADRVKLMQENLWEGMKESANFATDVLLFAAHLHVSGATFSRSERPIHVTDTYASHIEHVPKVSYAAFGHIHKPQALPHSEKGWYAGSPIPLDFGEMGETKFAIVVEAEPGRPPDIRPVRLSGGRALRKLAGTLDELSALAGSVGDALCLVTVHTDTPATSLSEKVRELFPDATILQVTEACAAKKTVALRREDAERAEPTFEELFREYLAEHGTRGAPVDRVVSAFSELLAAASHEEVVRFPEELLLEEADAREPGAPGDGAPADARSGGAA